MPSSCSLIPRNRLNRIPQELRLAHEYCFFLHDQCVALLVQYEAADAHTVTFKFRDGAEAKRFSKLAKKDAVDALRETGHLVEARRVILNTITMAMVSDSLHHIFEALKCIEKRKTVVALNLLRKPLTDSLVHLSWMLGDEDAFYKAFSAGQPEALTLKRLGNITLSLYITSRCVRRLKISILSSNATTMTLCTTQFMKTSPVFFCISLTLCWSYSNG